MGWCPSGQCSTPLNKTNKQDKSGGPLFLDDGSCSTLPVYGFDNGWSAVCQPWKDTRFFLLYPQVRFAAGVNRFLAANGWWLGELARLVYKDEPGEGRGGQTVGRRFFLSRVLLEERSFLDSGLAQCSLLEAREQEHVAYRLVVFRGSFSLQDWLTNLNLMPARWLGGGLVHGGFQRALLSIWPDLEKQLYAWRQGPDPSAPVYYAGHSQGGALAVLAASLWSPAGVYTFGAPAVGDTDFNRALQGVVCHRVVNHRDIVASLPPRLWPLRFLPSGRLVYIDGQGRLQLENAEELLAADRHKPDASLQQREGRGGKWYDPPGSFADHAPVNYVAHLARQALVRR